MAVRTVAAGRWTSDGLFRPLLEELPRRLPGSLRGYSHVRRGALLKIHYGHSETHFEAWAHAATARVEVGLHFEGSRDLNQEAFVFFRSLMVAVKAGLPRAELEPWDRGWARLYETIPVAEAQVRLTPTVAAYLVTLQPMLDDFWKEWDAAH